MNTAEILAYICSYSETLGSRTENSWTSE